jgi:hypothetical protein
MKKDKMESTDNQISFQEKKLDLIRLRIKNGYYQNEKVLENVVKQIVAKEIKKRPV